MQDATQDAAGVVPMGWALASCTGGVFFGIGYLVISANMSDAVPDIPTERFIGKSSEYISSYSDTYTALVKNKIVHYVSIGGLVGISICLLGVKTTLDRDGVMLGRVPVISILSEGCSYFGFSCIP